MITCSQFLKWTYAVLYAIDGEWKETKLLFTDFQHNHLKETLDESVRFIGEIFFLSKMDHTRVNEIMADADKHRTQI